MLLEAQSHNTACFLTLTYAIEPPGRGLAPADLTLFCKRLRRAMEPIPLRYFACGEYGEKRERPHYHLVVYSLGPTKTTEDLVQRTWWNGSEWESLPQEPGYITVRPFDETRAAYVAGYVVAKLRERSSPLHGRLPEFATMSRRPGLGSKAAKDLASVLTGRHGPELVRRLGDVPPILRSGSRWLVLDRYVKSIVRDEAGFDDGFVSPNLEALREQVLAVRSRSLDARRNPAWYLVDHQAAEMKELRMRSMGKRGQL